MSFAGAPRFLSTERVERPSRRSVVAMAGLGLAVPFIIRPARAAEITWRLGHSAPTNFPLHVRLVEAAGEIASRTQGRMRMEVYGNSELGSPVGLFAQLRAGSIDVAPMTSQLLSSNLALATLPMVGFAFSGYERIWAALDGELGAFIRQQIKERLGLIAMDRCWDFGFRQLTTGGRIVRTAGDIEGLRVRTPPDAELIGLFQALKALPVAMGLADLPRALQSRAVDGQEGVLPLVKIAKLGRYQTVCALTNHVWDGHWMCVGGKAWAKLPDDLRDVVARALNGAGTNQRKDTMETDASIRQQLEAGGMVFNAVDAGSFRSMLRSVGYYAEWRKRTDADGWALLEKYSGQLA